MCLLSTPGHHQPCHAEPRGTTRGPGLSFRHELDRPRPFSSPDSQTPVSVSQGWGSASLSRPKRSLSAPWGWPSPRADSRSPSRAHLHLLLKLLDLPLQRLHVGDEGHGIRGAGRVHRVLLQLLAGLWGEAQVSRAPGPSSTAAQGLCSPWRSASGILSYWSPASARTC